MAVALGRRPPSSDVVFFVPLVGGGLLSLLGLRPLLGSLGAITLDDGAVERAARQVEPRDEAPRPRDERHPTSVGSRLVR